MRRIRTSTIVVVASVVAALNSAGAQQPPSPSAIEPSLAVVVACNEEAAAATNVGDPLEPRLLNLDVGQDAAQSGSPIAHASDPSLIGIAPDRAEDLVYQLAYRECLERRGREPGR